MLADAARRLKRKKLKAAAFFPMNGEVKLKGRKHRMTVREVREALHDTLGPRLFAASMKLALLKRELKGSHARAAGAALKALEEARREARRLARGEGAEAPVDLCSELEALARNHDGVFVKKTKSEVTNLTVARDLLRIAREAAHNAVRHGGARRISIRLFDGRLEVEDDGTGLAKGWQEGMGMRLMRRRARRAGGGITLQRVAGSRTVLACFFDKEGEK